jgi:hypothetical protein
MSEQHSVWGVHMPERVGARAIEENYGNILSWYFHQFFIK